MQQLNGNVQLSQLIDLPGENAIACNYQLPEVEDVEHAVGDGIGAGGEEEGFVFPMIACAAGSPGGHGGDQAGVVVGFDHGMAAA